MPHPVRPAPPAVVAQVAPWTRPRLCHRRRPSCECSAHASTVRIPQGGRHSGAVAVPRGIEEGTRAPGPWPSPSPSTRAGEPRRSSANAQRGRATPQARGPRRPPPAGLGRPRPPTPGPPPPAGCWMGRTRSPTPSARPRRKPIRLSAVKRSGMIISIMYASRILLILLALFWLPLQPRAPGQVPLVSPPSRAPGRPLSVPGGRHPSPA